MDWPPSYVAELKRRADLELAVARNPEPLRGAVAQYSQNIVSFVADCCFISEPRRMAT
jgi:hypothetical protein